MTGCGIQWSHFAAPTCSTTNFHRTTSRGFVLAPNRSGAASRRQPTKAGIWSWCAGALAKVSVISRLESGSSSRGSCRWEDETEECGARGGLMLMLARSSVISGVTWWQVVFLMTWLHKDLAPASQHPRLQGHRGVPAPAAQAPT